MLNYKLKTIILGNINLNIKMQSARRRWPVKQQVSKFTAKRACRLKATGPNFLPITSFQRMRPEH